MSGLSPDELRFHDLQLRVTLGEQRWTAPHTEVTVGQSLRDAVSSGADTR